MQWFFIIINFYFEYFVAVMLGSFVGFIAAVIAAQLRSLQSHVVIHRVLMYLFFIGFTLLFCTTYVSTKTDPDFSVIQRYRQAWVTIRGWFWSEHPFLQPGGLEQALRMRTDWAVYPREIFYTVGHELFSVNIDGQQRRRRFEASSDIQQAIFSPDGRLLAIKTSTDITVLNLTDDQAYLIYDTRLDQGFSHDANIMVGGIQWSPDSSKVCFFVQKSSQVSSHTNWIVHDIRARQDMLVALGVRQTAFLVWSVDSSKLYFSQVRSIEGQGKPQYRVSWFAIALANNAMTQIADVVSSKMEIPDHELADHGIALYRQNKNFRLDASQTLSSLSAVESSSGKKIFVNTDLQLCYQSAYGVRYPLFGLSQMKDYVLFPPEGQERAFTVQEARWLPSEKYVLLKHYTHGLLVMDPVSRRIGILAQGRIGVFGMHPG